MTLTKSQLAHQLADMDPAAIAALRDEALALREQEVQRKVAGELGDPHGTVRYDPENNLFLRRIIEHDGDEIYKSWTVYFPENHEHMEDEDINPHTCPVIGRADREKSDDGD